MDEFMRQKMREYIEKKYPHGWRGDDKSFADTMERLKWDVIMDNPRRYPFRWLYMRTIILFLDIIFIDFWLGLIYDRRRNK